MDDQYAAELGHIVMAAADLEYCASGLAQYVLGDTDDIVRRLWGAMNGAIGPALQRAATSVPAIEPLRERFGALMEHRNQLIHGMWGEPNAEGHVEVLRPLRHPKGAPLDLPVDVRALDLATLRAFRADLSELTDEIVILWSALRARDGRP